MQCPGSHLCLSPKRALGSIVEPPSLKLLTHGLDTDTNLSKAWLSLVPGNSGQERQM